MRWNIDLVHKFVEENSECQLLSKTYLNNTSNLHFKCECGNEFETSIKRFAQRNKRQCDECGRYNVNNNRRYTIEQIKKYIRDFSLELISTSYKSCKEPLLFKCSCGNTFESPFDNVKNKSRVQCYECLPKEGNRFEKGMGGQRKGHETFAQQLYDLHKDEYLIIDEYSDAKTKLRLKHNCGFIWNTTPDNVINKKRRCPQCYDVKNSHLSKDIEKWLNEHSFSFQKEYRIKECVYKRTLPFDFAIFKNGNLFMLIEADGQHHFDYFRYIRDEKVREAKFLSQKKRDQIKNSYCEQNNIPLLRIPYFKHNELNTILENALL